LIGWIGMIGRIALQEQPSNYARMGLPRVDRLQVCMRIQPTMQIDSTPRIEAIRWIGWIR